MSRSKRRSRCLGPAFGNADYATAMARVKAIPGYTAIVPEKRSPASPIPSQRATGVKAIGAYERTLVSRSRFDDYLGGKSDALTAAERKGLRSFIDTGCVDCHSGAGSGRSRLPEVRRNLRTTGGKPTARRSTRAASE